MGGSGVKQENTGIYYPPEVIRGEYLQGSHRLDKIFCHDYSMTISQYSMTNSLLDFAFAAFCGKHWKMLTFYMDT